MRHKAGYMEAVDAGEAVAESRQGQGDFRGSYSSSSLDVGPAGETPGNEPSCPLLMATLPAPSER